MKRVFGERLRRARVSAGWSLRRLSALLDVSEAQVCRVEGGLRPPFGEEQTIRAADALGVGRWGLVAAALKEIGWPETARMLSMATEGLDAPVAPGGAAADGGWGTGGDEGADGIGL